MMSSCKCCLLTLVFLFSTVLQLSVSEAQSGPNILLILTGDHGYHDVSYYGTEDIRNLNIDKLVTSGMRPDNFYTNSPVCSPTRAASIISMDGWTKWWYTFGSTGATESIICVDDEASSKCRICSMAKP